MKCESLVKVKILVGGSEKTTKDHRPCGEPGIRYRVRRPYIGGLMHPSDKRSFVESQPSVSIEQVLCNKHKKKAIEEGMECIPIGDSKCRHGDDPDKCISCAMLASRPSKREP